MKKLYLLKIDMRKLAVAQIVLGLLVIGSFFAFGDWISNGYHVYEGTIPGSDINVRMHLNPGRATILEIWQFIYLALGLLVVGCGIAQFVKARRPMDTKEDKLESDGESDKVKV